MKRPAAVALAAALALLAACDKEKDVAPPAELVDIKTTLAVDKLWSSSVDGGGKKLRLALGIALDGDTLYAAGRKGDVRAIDAATGRTRWETDTDLALSAGPGAGGGLVAVATSSGALVALDAASGKQLWKAQAGGEVLAAPLVAAGRVVVRTVDGRLRAFAATDGNEAWMVEDTVPRLTLRGTSAPVLANDAVISGFDTGRVMSVALASGDILWQAQVGSPRGRSELERLADVDAAVRVAGGDVYAVGYQGRLAMLSLDTGQLWWAREMSSYRGLDVDDDQIYVSTSEGDVVALRRRDGSIVWTQPGLQRRAPSTPAVQGDNVVVGDFDGYLHWLDRATGRFVARERPGNARISLAPLVSGNRVFVIDEGGDIVAYRSGAPPGR
ncbi:MAG: outer membrane protein assembly factor BamB [Lysobacterales bacterium]|nr:MAG: outer membrane protein assembly factor BamB [Xanthomonadales bacterium]